MSGHNQTITMKHGRSSVRDRRPTEEQIAERAYELFLMRGAYHGADMEDWLQAEHELENQKN